MALFASVQTFLLLVRGDRAEVLFGWDRQSWPYVLFLWIKDLSIPAAVFLLLRRLLDAGLAARSVRDGPAERVGVAAGIAALPLVGLGVALRWILPRWIPPGVWVDWLFDADSVLRQPHGLPWIGGVPFGLPNRALVSYLYLHYCGALFALFGRGDAGLLALSAVAGTLMLPAIAWLTWEVAGRRCAIGALGVAAFAQWPIILSRWGWIATLLVTLLVICAAAALAAMRTGRLSFALLSGLAAGLATHTHPSAAAPLAGIGLFALWSLRRPGRGALVAAAALAAAFAFAPLAIGFLQNPRNLGGRARDASVYWTASRPADQPLQKARALTGALLSNTVLYTGVPIWTKDPNPRHILPGHAVLDPLLGLAALLGFAVSVERARRGSQAHLLLITIAVGSLLAGILSYPGGAPNTLRACGLLAPLIVWCALGVDWGVEWFGSRLAVRETLLWGLALSLLLAVETPMALNRWPEDPWVIKAFCGPETAAGRLRRELANRETILDRAVIRTPLVVEVLSGGRDSSRPIPRIPYETIDEVLSRRPPRAFWIVTDSRGLEALRRSGWRCARGVPLTLEPPSAVIALVDPT